MTRLDPPKSAACEHAPVTSDDDDLEFGWRISENARRGPPRAIGDERRQIEASRGCELEGVQRAVGAGDRIDKRRWAAGMRDALAERLKVDGAALRMQIELALGKLRHLRRTARDRDARYGMGAEVFQQ